jgi:hypothetical protein
MSKRFRNAITAVAAIAALATGGAVFAQAQNTANSTPASGTQSAPQSAQQSAPQVKAPASEKGGPENSATDRDNVQDQSGKDTATEKAGSETADGPEKAGAPETAGGTETAGSETPNNDGPGGHADEPGNPNADHQSQGNE